MRIVVIRVSAMQGFVKLLHTYTPKVCRIMALWAIFRGFGTIVLPTFGVQVGLATVFFRSHGSKKLARREKNAIPKL